MEPHLAMCVLVFSGCGRVAADQPQLSPQAKTLVAPVHEVFARIEADQATLPPPKDDRERLERRFDLDQAGRAVYLNVIGRGVV
jgi:hypothetical protein